MEHTFLLMFASLLCLCMTFGVGANDLANVMSTTMGSKSISVKLALVIAIIFELAGAFFGGSEVTETMRDKIINTSLLQHDPTTLMHGMLSILLACTIWMNLASLLGLPVSITNALVGSLVGFGAVVLGPTAIHWQQVWQIALSWIVSPLLAGTVSYALFVSMQILIFIQPDPLMKAKKIIPIYLLLTGIVLTFMTILKGLHHFHIELNFIETCLCTGGFSLLFTVLGLFWIKMIPEKEHLKRHDRFMQIEKYFGCLMGLTACAMVFAHGSNDVALAVSPLSIIYTLTSQETIQGNNYPAWITLLGCLGVIIGFLSYGKKIIETVGSAITALTPSRAFAATLSASTTVVISTSLGMPVSATQTLVGAVLGVGFARGIGALNLVVIRNIFMSWIFTLPVASLLTIMIYEGFHYIF